METYKTIYSQSTKKQKEHSHCSHNPGPQTIIQTFKGSKRSCRIVGPKRKDAMDDLLLAKAKKETDNLVSK